ncbi:MAG: NADH-ubiquinone oxidoreductase-F iron-sulfur binding region domain-containing protein [Acidimicrobiales bacterium]
MPVISRVLDEQSCEDLAAYIAIGGGEALSAARRVEPANVVDALERSGLRGRGGAGFPTATKWSSVIANASPTEATPVVINGAEGEPSTFKDRAILRNNPFRVIEGALVACTVLGSKELIVCLKRSFRQEWQRVTAAVDAMRDAGWLEDIKVRFVAGPSAYLFGEETALLEVVDNRQPLPRVTPPWRRGVDDGDTDGAPADAVLATPEGSSAAPVLVNNVETFANVALIVRNGPDWFREIGTAESPGSLVCTIVGDAARSGVAEFAMGTTLREAIEVIGGGALPERRIVAVLPGASGAVVAERLFDTPMTHEAFRRVGTSLGSAGFFCIDDSFDPLLAAYGAARFLAIESCGQCTPCKDDGLALTALLGSLIDGTAPDDAVAEIGSRLETVTNEARCNLALQQQVVVGSLIARCGDLSRKVEVPPIPTEVVDAARARFLVPLLDIVEGTAVFDEREAQRQPDWTFEAVDSGVYPAQRLQDVPVSTSLDDADDEGAEPKPAVEV